MEHHSLVPSGVCLPNNALWMWGMTPPPAIVALIRISNSSSPLIANWRCLGVILLTYVVNYQNTLEVLAGIACQLKHLSSEVLEDGRCVYGRCGADSVFGWHSLLEVSVDTADGKLQLGDSSYLETSLQGSGLRGLLALGTSEFSSLSTFSTFSAFSTLSNSWLLY